MRPSSIYSGRFRMSWHSDWPNCSSKIPVMLENLSRDGSLGGFANPSVGRNNPLPDRSIREPKATDEPAASRR